MTTLASPRELKSRFDEDGFLLAPPIIPAELLERVVPRMDAVIAGDYETGLEPIARHFTADDPPQKLRKVDQPHLCDSTIREVIAHPALGRWVAELLGARMVQAWGVQLLVKPPSGGQAVGHVGWHQDKYYWPYWEGEVFTVWIAVSDVNAQSGPMRFVRASHRWGYLEQGSDFFQQDILGQKQAFHAPDGAAWDEVPAILPPGAFSIHHSLTLHASGANVDATPRRSFAVHMRTEKSRPAAKDYYVEHLDDPLHAPILFEA